MNASAQQTLTPSGDYFPGFTPNSPEEKWLEETLKASKSARQGGLSGALTPASAGPRQLFESSPLPPHVEDSLPKDGSVTTAAAAHDAELHDWIDLIAQKKSELSAATAAAATATQELAALEAAAGLPQTIKTQTQNLKTQTQTQTLKTQTQTATEQAAARPPTQPTPTPTTRPTIPPAAQEPVLTEYQPDPPHKTQIDPVAADKPQTPANNQECARAHNHQDTTSLGFLRPTGSTYCQIDSILRQAVSRYKIEDTLLSNKMGISGLQDLYQTTVDRHEDLKTLLFDTDKSGEPLRKALSEFFFSFQGMKGCSNHTAAAATMIHAAASSKGFDLQIRQSLIAGIGLDPKEKEKVASVATATGRLPVRSLLYNQFEELRNEEWTDLLSIAVALLCFDPNKEQQFEKARAALYDSRLDNFTKSAEALAHVRKLLQDANTAFGKEFITNYDLFGMIKKKLSKEIQYEIDGLLADGDSADQLDCDWTYIDNTITKAWLKHSRRPQGYYDGILQIQQGPTDAPTVHSAMHPSAHDSLSDMSLVCERYNEDGSTCGETFIFNTAEQLRYKQLGLKNLPKSCLKHRGQRPMDTPRHYANDPCRAGDRRCDADSLRRCIDFQAGTCKYGDKCRFSHVKEELTNHNVTEESDEEELIVWHMSILDHESDDSVES